MTEREHSDESREFDLIPPEAYREVSDLIEWLEARRPIPPPAFRGALRRRLIADTRARPAPPPRLRMLVAAYAGSGLATMTVAAAGIAGIGPFAAG